MRDLPLLLFQVEMPWPEPVSTGGDFSPRLALSESNTTTSWLDRTVENGVAEEAPSVTTNHISCSVGGDPPGPGKAADIHLAADSGNKNTIQ